MAQFLRTPPRQEAARRAGRAGRAPGRAGAARHRPGREPRSPGARPRPALSRTARGVARGRLRRRRAPAGAGRGQSGRADHRRRSLHQRRRQAAGGDRAHRARQRRRHRPGRARRHGRAAGGVDRPRLPALPRSLAEGTPSPAALREPGPARPAGPYHGAGRRAAHRDRHRGLCPPQPRGSGAGPPLCLDGRATGPLAPALARLARHPLRGQGAARGAPAALSDLRPNGGAWPGPGPGPCPRRRDAGRAAGRGVRCRASLEGRRCHMPALCR